MRDEVVAFLTDSRGSIIANGDLLGRARDFFSERFGQLIETARLHPLGFYYAADRVDSRREFRFHLWPHGWKPPVQEEGRELHDHLYHLNSFVVAGALRHETFDVGRDDNGPFEICEVEYTSAGSGVRGTAVHGAAEIVTDSAHAPGCAYRLKYGVYHRVTPLTLPSATLVLTDTAGGPRYAHVLVRRGAAAAQEFARSTLGSDHRERVRVALAAL